MKSWTLRSFWSLSIGPASPAGLYYQPYRRDAFWEVHGSYRAKVLSFIRTLDASEWARTHEHLRWEASDLDRNTELYLLLRMATWEQRERLKGKLSGALWIRHIAEVIRRGFEEVHDQQWLEEDQDFRQWYPDGRRMLFGAVRPLDDVPASRPYVVFDFGLTTGSSVRWYVEGPTEFFAINQILSDCARLGIELFNLWGDIASGRGNAAFKLDQALKEDRALRRFSIISFDRRM
jgi:hypothetical protein